MTFFIFWLLTGAVGVLIDLYQDYRNGKNFTTKDISWVILGTVLGPIYVCVMVAVFLQRADTILIKGKDLSNEDDSEESLEDK